MQYNNQIGVSIVIVTFNRADLLKECLESFLSQTIDPDNIEFIVVNNNSKDDTEKIALTFENKLRNFKLVNESTVGLSYGRNKGVLSSNKEWVCFIDDDAKAHSDFLEKLIYNIEQHKFDAFGGTFYPWYKSPKPKWLSDSFGKMPLLRETPGELLENQFIAGGICAFKKNSILKAGLFPLDIGMRGNIVGYGEENSLQDKMRLNGDLIGFDPNWKIDHLVAEYKYTIKWQFKRQFAKGRDTQIMIGTKINGVKKIYLFLRALSSAFFQAIKNMPKLLFNKKYYIQNYILDSFSYFIKTIGSFYS